MPVLYNRISNQTLRACMLAKGEQRTTVSFYRYFSLRNPKEFRDLLYQELTALQVFGRIYIAEEGINAQISVPKSHFDDLRETLYSHLQLNGVRLNVALDDERHSFWVLRMKVRASILADGIKDFTFNSDNIGSYLKAEEVNVLADDPDVLFVDMRNHYEYEVGHFEHAIEIPSNTFREQLPMAVEMLQHNKNKKIVLYCTGGIRCEKASAWFIHKGFKNVYKVEGGVIAYVRRVREQGLPLKFIGKNFVFDERLGERITPDVIAYCHQCNVSYDSHTNCCNPGCHLLFIQCPECAKKYKHCCSVICQQEITLPISEQLARRSKKENGNSIKIFNKSLQRLQLTLKEDD